MGNSGNDTNRDPLSGAPGAHPAGTGVGGQAGKSVGHAIDRTAEAAHWQAAHTAQPYAKSEFGYEDYAPAYQLGYNSRGRYQTQSFDTVQDEMKGEWDRNRGNSRLSWEDAMPATRAAWHRVEPAQPTDADGDGS